jgi:hypothetical protein
MIPPFACGFGWGGSPEVAHKRVLVVLVLVVVVVVAMGAGAR